MPVATVDKKGDAPNSSAAFSDCCWFTLRELQSRRLRLRYGSKGRQLPVRANYCGFFMHETPSWIFLTQEEVFHLYPITPDTLRNVWLIPDCSNVEVILYVAVHGGQQPEKVVFILEVDGGWYMYSRTHGIMNFMHSIPLPAGQPNKGAASLLFIDVSAAVNMTHGVARRKTGKCDDTS
ncbi:hypothetical protein ERJ75_000942800 [Trypanosoma vivax]|nr:hypothetical protein TRVL_07930 [Trypanosoma vivax]KAH8611249.1 hypothetical protein ERJ75_000942800 [Trypanosoma vivax]